MNSLNVPLLERMVPVKLEQVAPQVRAWYTPNALRENMQAALEDEAHYATSTKFAEVFARSAPVSGAGPNDYNNRALELPHLGWSLAGIRFRGQDLARPFVNIGFSSDLPASFHAWTSDANVLSHAFAVFRPLHVRAFVPAHVPLELGPHAFWENRLLAAPIRRMLERPAPAHLERVRLERPDDLSFRTRYAAIYDDLHAFDPAHAEYASAEDEGSLASYLSDGFLWHVLVDGAWAGIVAAFRDASEGVRGFTVAEIVLERAFRGSGFGPAVQRRLVEALAPLAAPDDALLGTIHTRNSSAIRTALRSGREDIGGYAWVEVSA